MSLNADTKEVLTIAIQEDVKRGRYSDKAVLERLKKNVRGMDDLCFSDVVTLRKDLGIKLPRGRSKKFTPPVQKIWKFGL